MATQPETLYLEDLTVGDTFRTAARTLTETDIVNFAGLSGDFNPLHTDATYAASTPYGERIAHGLLGLSLVSGLAARLHGLRGTLQALTRISWRFRSPVKIGDTLRAQLKVQRVRKLPDQKAGAVIFQVNVLNQSEETVQEGRWTLLIKSKTCEESDHA
jgi:acyl dehydratase